MDAEPRKPLLELDKAIAWAIDNDDPVTLPLGDAVSLRDVLAISSALENLWHAAIEMRGDQCAGINWGCNSVQAFDAALNSIAESAGLVNGKEEKPDGR